MVSLGIKLMNDTEERFAINVDYRPFNTITVFPVAFSMVVGHRINVEA
jgi:hypothetical protein